MKRYTVGELRKKLNKLPDDTIVAIERVEDHYFEELGWSTNTFEFEPDQPGLENVVYMDAFGVTTLKDTIVICAHY